MNESFTSTEDNDRKIKHCLFNQIPEIETNQWQPENLPLNSSRPSSPKGEEESGSSSEGLPIQSNISQNVQTEGMIADEPPVTTDQNEPSKVILSREPPESISSNSSMPSQITITLFQESINSKILQENETVDSDGFSSSLKGFLNLKDKNYKPHVRCLKFLFSRLKDYSKRSLENLNNYIKFLEVKIKQEIESLRYLDALEAIEEEPSLDNYDIDEKVILGEIKDQNIKRRESRKKFYHTIKDQYERLVYWWRKSKERRQNRERHIEQDIILVLDRIQLEMEDMILCRLHTQSDKTEGQSISQKIRCKNPYLTKDKYLQLKYMMERQKSYLKLITDFSGKVITYMVSMFSKEEVQISKSIKQAMINYASSYMECYDQRNQVLRLTVQALKESDCESNVKMELLQSMMTMVPVELYDIWQRKKQILRGNNLESVLQDFSNCLQNTKFQETIQMNNDYIMFRKEAIWTTNSSLLQKEESIIMSDNYHMSKYQSRQIMTDPRASLVVPDSAPKKNIRVLVVLTSSYFIHLQKQDRVGTLKLGELKLSKKGRSIIICHKPKGLGSYFGLERQLGSLQFDSTAEVQQFAQKLSRALSKI